MLWVIKRTWKFWGIPASKRSLVSNPNFFHSAATNLPTSSKLVVVVNTSSCFSFSRERADLALSSAASASFGFDKYFLASGSKAQDFGGYGLLAISSSSI